MEERLIILSNIQLIDTVKKLIPSFAVKLHLMGENWIHSNSAPQNYKKTTLTPNTFFFFQNTDQCYGWYRLTDDLHMDDTTYLLNLTNCYVNWISLLIAHIWRSLIVPECMAYMTSCSVSCHKEITFFVVEDLLQL